MAGAAQIHEEAVKQTSILPWGSHQRENNLMSADFTHFNKKCCHSNIRLHFISTKTAVGSK